MVNMNKVKELLNRELDRGVKKTFLARKMGLPVASLYNYAYGGVVPQTGSLMKIAHYFDKPISYFLEDEAGEMSSEEEHVVKLYRTIRHASKEKAEDAVRFLEFTVSRLREKEVGHTNGHGGEHG